MTQLDRLEALAATAWEGYCLPDLIRVARAAKDVSDSPDEPEAWHVLNGIVKQSPLFSEVES